MSKRPPFVVWILKAILASEFTQREDVVLANVALKAVEEFLERDNPDLDDGA